MIQKFKIQKLMIKIFAYIVLGVGLCMQEVITAPPSFGVDFHACMGDLARLYRVDAITLHPQWKLVLERYERWIVKERRSTDQVRIPKIIHQIWLGSELPQKYYKLCQTWRAFHPDWEYKLWTDKEIQDFGLANQAQYDAAVNYGEKSDIARYEIICRYGGVYIDTDFECIQSFDAIHQCCDFYAGISGCNENLVYIANGLIGAYPEHPVLQACIKRLPQYDSKKNQHNNEAILNRSGPEHFFRCIFDVVPSCNDRSVIFPANYFYPWPWYYKDRQTEVQARSWIRPETFALHYWHCSWQESKK